MNGLLFFQKTSLPARITDKIFELEKENTDFSRIRCPLCRWQPKKTDRWMCSDGGFPEFFFNACYTVWNTFKTGGRCPGCNHQWRFTSCLRCHKFSPHEDWYVTKDE